MSNRRALGRSACALRGNGVLPVLDLIAQAVNFIAHARGFGLYGARPGVENFAPVVIAQAPVSDDVGRIAVEARRILFGVVKELLTLHRTSPGLRCSGDNAGTWAKFPT